MCLSSLMFTLKLNCSGKGNSPSISNDSELAGGGGLHSARDQDASLNDAKGTQSAVGGRIWGRLLAHIPPAQRLQALQASDNGDYPESSCSRPLLQQSAPAAVPLPDLR